MLFYFVAFFIMQGDEGDEKLQWCKAGATKGIFRQFSYRSMGKKSCPISKKGKSMGK